MEGSRSRVDCSGLGLGRREARACFRQFAEVIQSGEERSVDVGGFFFSPFFERHCTSLQLETPYDM